MLKAAGTVEEYEAKADSAKASLRQELRCFPPACMLTVTVKAGSVILTVVATDTAGAGQVESAAVALQTKPLGTMSSVLGITIEEEPASPSVVDVQVQVTRPAPSPPPPEPPSPPPSPLPPQTPPDVGVPSPAPPPLPDVGEKGTSISAATEDAGPGLAIGLALGGCLLVAMLAAAVFVWHRKRRMQSPASSASTAAPQQVRVVVSHPGPNKAAAPQSLSALLAACGLEHHEKTFQAEGYTLDTLLSAMERGEEAVKSDLRELKLTLGECRQLITQLGILEASNEPRKEGRNEYL